MSQNTMIENVRGDMLNCFTSAVATYLSHYRLDYTLTSGLQLYLALKVEKQRNGLAMSFIHHHRPLVGSSPLFTLHLTRHWSNVRTLAEQSLLQELYQKKPLLVVGDAYNLPWQIHYTKKHAPHWFVVEDINEARQMAHIRDPFEFIDAHGTQKSFDSWFPLPQLVDLAQVHSDPSPIYLARDLHSLGHIEKVPLEAYHGYQWFEATVHKEASTITSSYIEQELNRTHAYMTGTKRREDLLQQDWLTGLDALAMLPTLFQAYLTDPLLYEMKDDFWVAGRQRILFAHALRQASSIAHQPALEALADWCDTTLVPLWVAIPRLMLYNASCLQRQHPPRELLVQQAEKVWQTELEFMHKLETCLSNWARANNIYSHQNTTIEPEKWDVYTLSNQETILSPSEEEIYVAPENEIEEMLVTIWADILGLSRISILDNFFRLGGNSLSATRVLTHLSHMLHIQVSLLQFLENPTVRELSVVIEEILLADVANTHVVNSSALEQIEKRS